MKAREAALKHLLTVWDGAVVPPTNLEGVIRDLDASDADTMVERLRAATLTDFGDVPRTLAVLPSLTAAEVLHQARRLGWTVKSLADLNPCQDRSGLRIEAALASAAVWDDAGSFWEAARHRLERCRSTMAAFEIVLRHRAVRSHVPHNAPVWEREHLQTLQEAEWAGDWARLGEKAQAFRRLPRPDLSAQQATLALALLDWPRLVRLADKIETWFQGHLLLSPLALADAVRLATASRSGHVRFTALERVVRREARDLSAHEEAALRNLLVVLAKDENGWPGWLAICNHYPLRHPHMQAALGRALARGGVRAFQAYVESISLSTSDSESRECVTRCLSVFRARAGAERRCALWRKVFERWQAWDFAASEKRALTAVARSALDYGVVGWLVEGEPREQSADLERSFEQSLRALDMQWHDSLSAAVSSFHRAISRYQVFAHAGSRSAGDPNWLPGPSIYIPTAAADGFVQRRYGWNDP